MVIYGPKYPTKIHTSIQSNNIHIMIMSGIHEAECCNDVKEVFHSKFLTIGSMSALKLFQGPLVI